MTSYLFVIIGAVLVNNVVLVRILGLCPFMGVSKKLETAVGMGAATTFVLTLSSICAYLTDHYLLIPLGLEYLRTIAFILVIAVVVQYQMKTILRQLQGDGPTNSLAGSGNQNSAHHPFISPNNCCNRASSGCKVLTLASASKPRSPWIRHWKLESPPSLTSCSTLTSSS